MSTQKITVLGAGVLGLWQALTLARAGRRVRLLEATKEPFENSASLYAGVMLAPDRETETAPPQLRELGREGIALWKDVYPELAMNGALVVASPRDRTEFDRFARHVEGHERIDAARLAELEPELQGRFPAALFFPNEAHMAAPEALAFLLDEVRRAGVAVEFGVDKPGNDPGTIIDCRGFAAREALPNLRGVRGERVLVRTREIALRRPVQLLHPRQPIYIVPWSDGRYMIGATVLETADDGPVSVRSVLELLGAAYVLHPAFAEAEVLDIGAGVRPAFPDNMPQVIVRDGGEYIFVNGAYRHGFLLAPVLAKAVAAYLDKGTMAEMIVISP